MNHGRVKVPHEFFAKAKLEYQNWTFAFFREAVQNSYDAGASEIHITADSVDGGIEVAVRDNGKGMDRRRLLNVLLCLGASEKDDPDSVGGFGYAKTLLFFAHTRYEIHTREHLVRGAGGEYQYELAEFPYSGTKAVVLMSGVDLYDISRALRTFVSHFHPRRKCQIFYNGELCEPSTERYPMTVNTDLGRIRFKENGGSHTILWVRSRGLPMFEHVVWSSSSTAFVGVLDLGRPSTEVLTANRDGLKSSIQRRLAEMVGDLEKASLSAKFEDPLDLVLNPSNLSEPFSAFEGPAGSRSGVDASVVAALATAPNTEPSPPLAETPSTGMPATSPFATLERKNRTRLEKVLDRFRRLDTSRYPKNFCITTAQLDLSEHRTVFSGIRKDLAKSKTAKLAHYWDVAVREVIRGLSKVDERYSFRKTVDGPEPFFGEAHIKSGYVYSPHNSVEALLRKRADLIQVLLNPNTLPKRWLIGDLVDLAIHELAHMNVSGHGDRFVDEDMRLTRIFRRTSGEKRIETLVRDRIRTFVLNR